MKNDEKLWIQMFDGSKHYVLEPERSKLKVKNVARALSMQCRYAGHVSTFFSVAEHSFHVSQIVQSKVACTRMRPTEKYLPKIKNHRYCGLCLHSIRWAFVHDWSEAFLGDVTRPLKHSGKLEGYRVAEKRTQRWITDSLGLNPEEPPLVKQADTQILGTEAFQLKQPIHRDWGKSTATGKLPDPIKGLKLGWTWQKAERMFLARFKELFGTHLNC